MRPRNGRLVNRRHRVAPHCPLFAVSWRALSRRAKESAVDQQQCINHAAHDVAHVREHVHAAELSGDARMVIMWKERHLKGTARE
ncbi:hypothetical protein MRX96_007076 [Rhipicephalus microplus]